ncbi:MAG: glycosyltransferase family 2 protein [Planctomycetaceae bacterium]|jgi:dolichol-phosphate mannosyltransferase|nr:glycosyltransferase family 2 protein [Planctomycetaceae bacterium]
MLHTDKLQQGQNYVLRSAGIDDNDFIEISVVAPAFNETENIAVFTESVSAELSKITDSWEIIFVDDGSSDNSLEVLQNLRSLDNRIKIIRFSRNFGHQIAISAGLQYAAGNAVIVMDADLQHPPELIPQMIESWRKGYHIVCTIRTYNKETGWFKRKSSEWFYSLCNIISDVKFIDGAADFRLLDRKAVDQFNAMPEQSRFVRGMIRWLGFKETYLKYTANPRRHGVSKYSFKKMITFAIDGITSFSISPLRWIIYFGFSIAMISLLYTVYVLFEIIVTGNNTPGWPTLIVAVLFLGGMQLISIGVVGEYVGRIYIETKKRPLFVVQEEYGFNFDNRQIGDNKENRFNNDLKLLYSADQINFA